MGIVFLAIAIFNGVVAKRCFDDALDASGRGLFGWMLLLIFGCAINMLAAAMMIADGLKLLLG